MLVVEVSSGFRDGIRTFNHQAHPAKATSYQEISLYPITSAQLLSTASSAMLKFRSGPRPRSSRYIWTLLFFGVFTLFVLTKVGLSPRDVNSDVLPRAKHSFANRSSTTLKILIWNVGQRMQRRFLRSFGATEKDPFRYCTVRNCVLEIDNNRIGEASAVMFHLHLTEGPHTLPLYRRPEQFWIFFTDESPEHTFLLTKKYKMKDYNGIFNLSMTYRSDSDIPVPYGRTVRLSEAQRAEVGQLPNFAANKKGLVAILGSNCGGTNRRWEYVHELKKHIQVDIYGGCGDKKPCPGHFNRDCDVMKGYKFYLAFENSNCREYITEKLWWNAYAKEVLPVVMGGSKSDYEKLCPPRSFIHVDDFESPKHLAEYLKELSADDAAYNEFFQWKKEYKVLNEHGYFGSPSLHLCRMCEVLNSPKLVPKVYSDLQSFWDTRTDCREPLW